MSRLIRVAILDDHQSIIDGYQYRLNQAEDIQVIASGTFGDALEPMLARNPVDVLLLDISIPTSPENPNPYPVLHLLPQILQRYPELNILVVSMHNQPALIKLVMEAGASGYILKDDLETIKELNNVIRTVASGGIHLSKQAYQQLFKKMPKESTPTARQLQALSLCAAYPDKTTSQLSSQLGVAHSTFRNLLSEAYLRLEVHTRLAAVAKAQRLGLLTPLPENPKL